MTKCSPAASPASLSRRRVSRRFVARRRTPHHRNVALTLPISERGWTPAVEVTLHLDNPAHPRVGSLGISQAAGRQAQRRAPVPRRSRAQGPIQPRATRQYMSTFLISRSTSASRTRKRRSASGLGTRWAQPPGWASRHGCRDLGGIPAHRRASYPSGAYLAVR
jgi:hypothetical protein